MALGAMDKYGCQVNLVPAGFNYYNPQNFRSKVILEFGPAYKVPQELVDLYRTDKKKAISTLLEQLEKVLAFTNIVDAQAGDDHAAHLRRDVHAVPVSGAVHQQVQEDADHQGDDRPEP